MTVHVVVPARLASTRLPDKPLADIGGQPMIVRVAQQVARSEITSICVAVDDERVLQAAQNAGVNAVMTRTDHPAGSDRVMEVAEQQGWSDRDIVINVQGDEPLIPPAVINYLADTMQQTPELEMATLAEEILSGADFHDPNVVKVVCNSQADALYFSRAPIPFPREVQTDLPADLGVLRHVGVYAFRVAALRAFVGLRNSRLEAIEKLEQLRWLEAGRKIRVLLSPEPVPGGIDTPEDLARVRRLLAARG